MKEPDVRKVRRYLKKHVPKKRISVLIITHPHSDHYNLLPYVLCNQDPKEGVRTDWAMIESLVTIGNPNTYTDRWTLDGEERDDHDYHPFPPWVKPVAKTDRTDLRKAPWRADKDAFGLFGKGEVRFRILAADIGKTVNDRSIVLMVSYGEFDLLLMGDATKKTQDSIIKAYRNNQEWLDCEVFKAAHHGSVSHGSNNEDWIDVVKPEVSVFTPAQTKMHGHPRIEVAKSLDPHMIITPKHWVRLWKSRSRKSSWKWTKKGMFSTATNGTIVMKTDGTVYNVTYIPKATERAE